MSLFLERFMHSEVKFCSSDVFISLTSLLYPEWLCFKLFVVLGIEHRALYMLTKYFATKNLVSNFLILFWGKQ